MSVIVKGRNMPRHCGECACSNYYEQIDALLCDFTETQLDEKTWKKERHPDCPLIELPPHGRLIDADKLNIHDISPVDGFCVMGVTEEDIELADTVIEAEGSET